MSKSLLTVKLSILDIDKIKELVAIFDKYNEKLPKEMKIDLLKWADNDNTSSD